LVLPAERAAALDPVAGQRAASLVVIDAGRWALACSHMGDVVELHRADINWRSSGSKRLWLAGTVKHRACALLDVEQLILLLDKKMA
jgi:purine-binding chemotaxis protein CheW